MANWTYTEYVISGPGKDDLYDFIKMYFDLAKMIKEINRDTIVPHEPLLQGNGWFGDLLALLGEDPKQKNCRGFIESMDYSERSDHWTIFATCAWAECSDVRIWLEKKFDVKITYYDEEPGNCIYDTNDFDRTYFDYEYITDIVDDGIEYFKTLKEALEYVSKVCKKEFKSAQEFKESMLGEIHQINRVWE